MAEQLGIMVHLDSVCEGDGHLSQADICEQVAQGVNYCQGQHADDLAQEEKPVSCLPHVSTAPHTTHTRCE